MLTNVALLAALYFVIGFAIPMLGFGMFQIRLGDALYPCIPLFGIEGVIGLTIGQFIYNVYGFGLGMAIGPWDLLSPLLFLPFKWLIYKKGIKMVPLHIIAVALWIPFLLNMEFGAPFWFAVLTVGGGETIAEGLGILLYKALKEAGI